jgi:hypothetical protein
MELVKRPLENIDISFLNTNSEYKSGLVEFEYKDVLYIANTGYLSYYEKAEFLNNYKLLEKQPTNWSETDWINEQFEINWESYTDQILLEYPNIWELDEERMWNEESKLTLADNTIQFKKPFDLFAGLEEGSEIDIFSDGQNTMASPKDNPSPWIAEIEIDIRKWIECKGKEKEITEVNEFEFVGRGTDTHIYFYFEGMTVVFKKEVPNPYPNNCSLCSDFVSDKDLYCSDCTQIED